MHSLGQLLKSKRENKGFSLDQVSQKTHIDSTYLSRIESDKRLPTLDQIKKLSKIYDCEIKELIINRNSDKILNEIKNEKFAVETPDFVQKNPISGENFLPSSVSQLNESPLSLENRRYIGSKSKLADWIINVIDSETNGLDSFFDIFAGTGVLAQRALKRYGNVIINDILHSNNVIYHAFFQAGPWNKGKIDEIICKYNSISPDDLNENYFSQNFGHKFFEHGLSKLIGHIREDIESKKSLLTEKERCILLATLVFNIDRHANTVGHFDAYIKKPIKPRPFKLRKIKTNEFSNVRIHREDANKLAHRVKADLTYIDPPYNSRQYSRFYHLYETLVKWNKPPLTGVALKPPLENMSDYCTVKARKSLADLCNTLNSKYLVLSYNNTYASKSGSSENKIKLDEIEGILKNVGKTKIFECSHKYFNAGKTDFSNHKEFLFFTKVNGK